MRRERKRKKKFQFNCHDVRRVFRKTKSIMKTQCIAVPAGMGMQFSRDKCNVQFGIIIIMRFLME